MKRMNRLLAMLIALLMIAVSGLAETAATEAPAATEEPAATEAPANTVIGSVNGTPLYLSELQEAYNYYTDQGYSVTYNQVFGFLVETELLKQLIHENGFDAFTDEQRADYEKQAQEVWENAIQDYTTAYLSEDTEEARAALRVQADQYFRAQGYAPETLAESIANQDAQERYLSSLASADSVTREDVQAYLDKQVQSEAAQLQGSAYMYELYQMYYGMDFLYTPEGYRRVLHILLSVDNELMEAYNAATEEWEKLSEKLAAQASATEAAEPEAAEPEATPETAEAAATEEPEVPVTQADVDAAHQKMEDALKAVIASKQVVIDEIESRLANGEEFKTIAPEYNEDPGEDFDEGYKVHPESFIWDPVFRDAAFSAEMAKPGDHSKPVVGSYGIHILYYLEDVPSKPELTDELYNSLLESVLSEKQYDLVYAEIDKKEAESSILKDEALLNSLDGADDDVSIDFAEDGETEEETPAEAEETKAE